MTVQTWPDVPTHLHDCADDLEHVLIDSDTDLPAPLTYAIGQVIGVLRHNAVWLRAAAAAATTPHPHLPAQRGHHDRDLAAAESTGGAGTASGQDTLPLPCCSDTSDSPTGASSPPSDPRATADRLVNLELPDPPQPTGDKADDATLGSDQESPATPPSVAPARHGAEHQTTPVRSAAPGTGKSSARRISPEGRERMRQNGRRRAAQRRETALPAAATTDQLTTCRHCHRPRLIDGEHPCHGNDAVATLHAPPAAAPTVEHCTHSATADGITQQCAEPAGHDGPHSWEYKPRMETAHNLHTPSGTAVAS